MKIHFFEESIYGKKVKNADELIFNSSSVGAIL
jgi:hypothetical protein